jgi:hypothetical protein
MFEQGQTRHMNECFRLTGIEPFAPAGGNQNYRNGHDFL